MPEARVTLQAGASLAAPCLRCAARSKKKEACASARPRANHQLPAQWVNYLFVPESINTELRGAGVLSWASEHVLPNLAAAPPGRLQAGG